MDCKFYVCVILCHFSLCCCNGTYRPGFTDGDDMGAHVEVLRVMWCVWVVLRVETGQE